MPAPGYSIDLQEPRIQPNFIFLGTFLDGVLHMTEPNHVFRLHFHVKTLKSWWQIISVVPHADQAIQVLLSAMPDALITEAEDLGLRSAFSDEAFARLIAEAKAHRSRN